MYLKLARSRYSSEGDWMIGGSIPDRGWECLHYRVQTGPGTHPASYPMGTSGSFLFPCGYSGRVVKPNTRLHLLPKSKNEWNYTYTPTIRLHGVMLSYSTGTTLPLPDLNFVTHYSTKLHATKFYPVICSQRSRKFSLSVWTSRI
jgi:hypothetical protein